MTEIYVDKKRGKYRVVKVNKYGSHHVAKTFKTSGEAHRYAGELEKQKA